MRAPESAMTEIEMEACLDALAARLDALEARGAARFDPAGCRCVRALLSRAESLASSRLVRRAEARLDALESSWRAAHDRAEAGAAELAESGERDRELSRALARGDLLRARQRWRRVRALPPRRPRAPAADAGGYRRAAAEFSAAVTVARARAHVPASAGPYNGALVATRALDRLAARSPTYVHALVERLEDLAALRQLAPPPPPSSGRARGGAATGKRRTGDGRAKADSPGRRRGGAGGGKKKRPQKGRRRPGAR